MDCKELIELAKKAAAEWHGTHEYYQAATLITALCEATETLLAERDAAVGGLIGDCSVCKHLNKFERVATGKCTLCKYSKKMLVPISNIIRGDDNWEWTGPTPP